MSHRRKTAAGRPSTTNPDVDELIRQLADYDVGRRQAAREALVAIGPPATAALTEALTDPRAQVRWEAAKTLTELTDPSAIPALIESLTDEDSGIRWLAAEALIAIGPPAIEPLLRALVDRADSPAFREGTHHVLHDLRNRRIDGIILPVLDALNGPAPEDTAPVVAARALGERHAFQHR